MDTNTPNNNEQVDLATINNIKEADDNKQQVPSGDVTDNFFKGTNTYSEAELRDPNTIQTTINDRRTPLVVMFGARTIGKTAALIRLTRYLESEGYIVRPERSFRPAYDTHYQTLCDHFHDVVYSPTSSGGTEVMSFMLVTVYDKKERPICQIVEAPGEHYFEPRNVTQPFPRYLINIFTMPNPKVWVFFHVKMWEFDDVIHRRYAERIEMMKRDFHYVVPRDRVIFACTKVDQIERQVPFKENGKPNIPLLYERISGEYPVGEAGRTQRNIFSQYENAHPISRLWRPHNYLFIPFSAGSFTDPVGRTKDNGEIEAVQFYTPGDDYYPAMLWYAINKKYLI